MKSVAIISSFIAIALAGPITPLSQRQTVSHPPAITEVTYRVSNLENLAQPKFVDTKLIVNGGATNFDADNALVGAGPGRLNTNGLVYATRLDVLSSLQGIHCNVYNGDKHIIAELSETYKGADFDGIEGVNNKAAYADKYSLLCYYV